MACNEDKTSGGAVERPSLMEKRVKVFHDELAARRLHFTLYDKRKIWGRLKAEENVWLGHEIRGLANSVVLDAGCGPGPHIGLVLEKGAKRVIALDFSSNMLLLVREAYQDERVERLCADLRYLPLREGAIDCILCLDTLHHLKGENLRIALHGLLHSARGGSSLFIDIKNRGNPVLAWRYRNKESSYLPGTAATRKEIKDITSGLSIIEKEKGIGFALKSISPYIIFRLRRL